VVKEVKVYSSKQENKDTNRLVVEKRPDGTVITTTESDKTVTVDTKTLEERLAETLKRTTEEKERTKVSSSEIAKVAVKRWYARSEWSTSPLGGGTGVPERLALGARIGNLPLFIDVSKGVSLSFKDIRLGVTYEF
jgi:hypothetical protein